MTESLNPSLATLLAPLATTLSQRYGKEAIWAAAAPGRVNIIGDHTDYSEGLALPMGIDLYTLVVAASRDDDRQLIRLFSAEEGEAELALGGAASRRGDWTDYLRGVLALYEEQGAAVPPMDLVIGGNLPLGAGLSSSASLELCFATLIETVTGHALRPEDRALLCQRAEHDYAGVPCGILDQFAVSFAREGAAMLLDCRDQNVGMIELPGDLRIAIVDSGVRHALADGGYGARRAQVEAAEHLLGKSLRDARPEDLTLIPDKTVRQRAKHVITENARVLAFQAALSARDPATAGQLMYQSHDSLSRDFAVSCIELDTLVAAARRAGALGARMTGGGFGGSMVAFVNSSDAMAFEEVVTTDFRKAGFGEAGIRWVTAAAGARSWALA
ncbi:galactokinase [Congregibacter litoralis]|uniref:galactokinase n=1 Tax=Congregibacter litoralis TaxID=393662 RepID=UPI00146FB455|nr:galactokinase [Congregibacter litoralis]